MTLGRLFCDGTVHEINKLEVAYIPTLSCCFKIGASFALCLKFNYASPSLEFSYKWGITISAIICHAYELKLIYSEYETKHLN